MTVTVVKKSVAEMKDWDLVVLACHHSRKAVSLSESERDSLYRAVYSRSDGYGEPGYIPVQGYDWSGVRDSSLQAQEAMVRAARWWFANRHIAEVTYEDTSL